MTSPRPRHVLPYFALKLKRLPLGGGNLQQNVQVASAVPNVQLAAGLPNVQLTRALPYMQLASTVQSTLPSAQVNAPATRSALNNMSTAQLPFRQVAFDQQANTPSFLNQQTHLVMRSGVLNERNTLPELQPGTPPVQRAVLNPVASQQGQQIMWNNVVAPSQRVQQSALLAQQLSMSNTTANRTALSAAIVARERLLQNFQTAAIQRSQRSTPAVGSSPQTSSSLRWMQHQAPTSQVQSSVHSAFPRTQSRNPASSTTAAGVVNRRLSNTNLYVTPTDQCMRSGDVQSQGTPSTPDLSYGRFVLRANPASTESSRVSVASLGGLSGGTCVSYTPEQQVSIARSVASPTRVASPIGMRLPTVSTPGTEPDVSHNIIQPIVIQPSSDVTPSFLRTPPHDAFSDGANVFPTDIGSLDSTMQNAVLGSAMDESEAVAAGYPSRPLTSVNNVSVEQPIYSEVTAEQPTCSETLVEQASSSETLAGQATCSDVPMEKGACSETLVRQATCSGVPMEQGVCTEMSVEQPVCSDTLVGQASCSRLPVEQTTCSDIAMECTESASTGFSGDILGTVSEVPQTDVAHADVKESSDEQLPELLKVTTGDRTASEAVSSDGSPVELNRSFDEILGDLLKEVAVFDDEHSCDDRLGSMQCDIDSGREILPTPGVDTMGDVVSHDCSGSATVDTTGDVVSHGSSDSATADTTGGVVSHDGSDSATVDTTGDVVSLDRSDGATDDTTGGVVSLDRSDSATVDTTGDVVSQGSSDSATVDTTGGVVSHDSSDSAKSVKDDKPNDSSKIYLNNDGSLELIIKQRVKGSSSGKGSVTDDGSLPRLLKPVNDAANWRRFLTDKRFQPVVVLRRLRSVPHRSSSSTRDDKKKRHHSHSHVSKSQDIASEDSVEFQDGRQFAKRHRKHKHKKEKRHRVTQAVEKKRSDDVVKRHTKSSKAAGSVGSGPYNPKLHAEKLSPTAKPWRSCIRVSNGDSPAMWKKVDAKLRHGRSHNMFGTWKQNGQTKAAVCPTVASGESCHRSPKSHRETLSGIGGHVKQRVANNDRVSEPATGAIDRVSWFSQSRRDDCQKKLIVLDAPGGKEPCCKPVSKARRSTDGASLATGEQQNPRRSSCSALVDAGVRNRIGSDINRKTPVDKDGKRTISLSRYRDDCAKKRLQESDGGPYVKRVSWAVQETDACVGSTADTTRGIMTSTVGGCPGDVAGSRTKGYAPPVSTSISCHNASPSLHSSRSPSTSTPTSILSHKLPCTRNMPKTSPHEALAQDGGIAAAFLMSRGHQKHTASGGNIPTIAEVEARSRHGSGLADLTVTPEVCGQNPGTVDTNGHAKVGTKGHALPASTSSVACHNMPPSVNSSHISSGNSPNSVWSQKAPGARNSPKTTSHGVLERGHQRQTASGGNIPSSGGNIPTIPELEARSRNGSGRADLTVAPVVCGQNVDTQEHAKVATEGHALPASTSSVACHNMPPSVNSSHISSRNSPTSVWSHSTRNSPKTSSHEALAQDGGIAATNLLSRGRQKQTAKGGNMMLSGGNIPHSSGNMPLSSGNVPPSGGNIPPSGGNVPPSGGNIAPSSGNIPPSDGNVPPSGGNVPPSGGNVSPLVGGMPPTVGSMPSSDGNVPPSSGNILPSGGNVPPSGGNLSPSGGNIPPSGGNVPPLVGSMPPTVGSISPSDGNVPPSGGNVSPLDGNVPSSGGNVPPSGGNVLPSRRIVPPSGGNVPSSCGNVPPSDGNVLSSGGTVPPSGGNIPSSGGNVPHSSGNMPLSRGNVLEARSRHHSGHEDLPVAPEVRGQDPNCVADDMAKVNANEHANVDTECDEQWLMTELTIVMSAAVDTYKQRRQDSGLDSTVDLPHRQDSNVNGTVDPRLLGMKRVPCDEEHLWRTTVEFGMSRTGFTAVDQHTIAAAASAMSPKGSPSYPDESMLELAHCEKELLGSVDTPQGVWNTSRLANPAVLKIVNEYLRKPQQERHQLMLIYSAKVKKMREQVKDDDTFADSTSASISSASKKQHERQKLYKVLVDINAQMTADRVKIASIPGHDRDIYRRIDRSLLDCEIINDLLGDLNRFHLDKQIHVLPKVLRLPSEFDRCLSMEGQFLFLLVKPIPLIVCSKLYVLKLIIEAVYEELSSPVITDSRKLWLLLALGWLHTDRRKKLSELCHTEAGHVIDLAVHFHSRRAWYR